MANRQDLVAEFFAAWGWTVSPISEAERERADYWVTRGNESHVVEVKTMCDDADFRAELSAKGTAQWEPELEYSEPLAKRLRKCGRQTATTPGGDTAFKIGAFVLGGMFKDTQVEQLRNTIYGIVDLLDLDTIRADKAETYPCYFFGPSVFARGSKLHAVLALWPNGAERGHHRCQLYPNPLAEHADAFTSTALRAMFKKARAAFEPLADELRGCAYVVDDIDIPITAQEARLAYVQKKYGRPYLTPMTPGGFHGAISVELDALVK